MGRRGGLQNERLEDDKKWGELMFAWTRATRSSHAEKGSKRARRREEMGERDGDRDGETRDWEKRGKEWRMGSLEGDKRRGDRR